MFLLWLTRFFQVCHSTPFLKKNGSDSENEKKGEKKKGKKNPGLTYE